ncbi:MAG: SAM-dependent methyltransferase [Pseudomonadota bacterium]
MSERSNKSVADLPPPGAEAEAHSARLRELIVAEIAAAGGAISFARFMELALYAPGLGYYSAGARKFGAAGDFITAPELSPLFARCVARQCAQVLHGLGQGDVLEVGAGSGVLAADLLAALAELGSLPEQYFILELSADLRERQQRLLRERVPEWSSRVVWLNRLPAAPFRGVVLANELLDALPVHLFTIAEMGPRELLVGETGGTLQWRLAPLTDARLQTRIDAIHQELSEEQLPAGYTSEINLAAEAWLRSMADVLQAGAILLIDYGFPRREYYHPQRAGGTLMCHYRHRAHGDPLIMLGLQDITAHLDFTALAEAALEVDLTVAGYTTQGAFLLATGITEQLAATAAAQQLQRAQEVKKLTLPHEMGELFKVMALTRGVDEPLLGFAWRDLRTKL